MLILRKHHVDTNLTPEGWKVGLFAWTGGKNNGIQQIPEMKFAKLFKMQYNLTRV